MITIRILVCGLGRVGRAFVELLSTRRETIAANHEFWPLLSAAVDIDGAAVAPRGAEVPPSLLLEKLDPGIGPSSLEGYGCRGMKALDLIHAGVADVLVETTPTSIRDGEPGLTHITQALGHRMHVITASKGPLVLEFGRLRQLAQDSGTSLKFSAATAAALPALDVGTYCLAGASIRRIEGILNGTTNFILSCMQDQGVNYQQALSEAQTLGIAESDPSLDVEGWDSASKLLLLANALMGSSLVLRDVEVSGITGVQAETLRSAAQRGKTLKLLAQAEAQCGKPKATVQLCELAADHPLSHVTGAEKAVTYTTDTMDRITVTGGRSDPRGAAAAVLKDLIHLMQERNQTVRGRVS